jgi:HEAT repeat protein
MSDITPEATTEPRADADSATTYSSPVDRLLKLGAEAVGPGEPWSDYVAEIRLGEEHVPALLRMVADEGLNWADAESAEVWAPVHAWRALGQLGDPAAVDPLLGFLDTAADEDLDLALEEIPVVLGMIGEPALPALRRFLGEEHDPWATISAANALHRLVVSHPAARDEAVAALTARLEAHASNDVSLNSFLVLYLSKLGAVEAAPVMEKAFAADHVDCSVMGDWEDVQVKLGLREKRSTPPPKLSPFHDLLGFSPPDPNRAERQARRQKQKKVERARTRNKLAKQSRKKNRKRR